MANKTNCYPGLPLFPDISLLKNGRAVKVRHCRGGTLLYRSYLQIELMPLSLALMFFLAGFVNC